jgi:hypothetical protein
MFYITESCRKHFLVELTVFCYTKGFLEAFFIFLKQRFFKSFIKWGSSSFVFNKYTFLGSSFVNKSSCEQIEKRVFKKKLHLVFSEFDFLVYIKSSPELNPIFPA